MKPDWQLFAKTGPNGSFHVYRAVDEDGKTIYNNHKREGGYYTLEGMLVAVLGITTLDAIKLADYLERRQTNAYF